MDVPQPARSTPKALSTPECGRSVSHPGVSGGLWRWVAGLGEGSVVLVVGVFEFGRWYVPAGLEEAPVEPVDAFEGGDLDLLDRAPRPTGLDQLGLVQPDHGLATVAAPIPRLPPVTIVTRR